ncbi:hypothetical protein SKAU_G00073940 [Synaphobranchus kaupii]|uniref:Uncharacterized protein n=1 Tax=Synaphobranchus kaupii TaxID=118154 RepID=A0A9Q1J9T0_SYNKA|nr:hypothetical protein SKAU_G00073940 [Synaphobranchus kaupii]
MFQPSLLNWALESGQIPDPSVQFPGTRPSEPLVFLLVTHLISSGSRRARDGGPANPTRRGREMKAVGNIRRSATAPAAGLQPDPTPTPAAATVPKSFLRKRRTPSVIQRSEKCQFHCDGLETCSDFIEAGLWKRV